MNTAFSKYHTGNLKLRAYFTNMSTDHLINQLIDPYILSHHIIHTQPLYEIVFRKICMSGNFNHLYTFQRSQS